MNTLQYTLGATVHPESLAQVAERLGANPKRTNPLANLSTPPLLRRGGEGGGGEEHNQLEIEK